MCLENPPIDGNIIVVASSSHRKGPGSIPRGAKYIFLVATELAYKSSAAEGHSPEYLATFSGMFGHIPCLTTFPGMVEDIPRNVGGHSSECLATFPGMFGDILRNVWQHSPHSPHSVPRSCIPVFIHSPWNHRVSLDLQVVFWYMRQRYVDCKWNARVFWKSNKEMVTNEWLEEFLSSF